MKYLYPVVFETQKSKLGEDSVYVAKAIDVEGAIVSSQDMRDALYKIKDLLKVIIANSPQDCKTPSTIRSVKKLYPKAFIMMVEVEI